jgi:maleylacetate reductase
MNAMAHAVEALYAKEGDPLAKLMAEESVRQLAGSLPAVVNEPHDLQARASSLYGAWLAAMVLDRVGMALHHKLCHTLGGSFNMPHAQTHTVILPYVVRYNAPAIPEALSAMSRALDCLPDNVPGAIQDISRENGGPISLQELGLAQEQLEPAAQMATRAPYYNPRPVDAAAILALLQGAYTGQRP